MSTSTRSAERRLLFLLPFPPRLDATHGGARVAAQLLAALATGHSIAVAYLRGDEEQPIDAELRAACDIVEEIARPWSGRSVAHKALRAARMVTALLIGRRPLWVTDCASRAYARRIRALATTWQPDVLHIEVHVMGQYVRALDDCPAPRVLAEYEPGVRAAPFIARGYPWLARALHVLDRRAWRDFEREVLRQVHAVVVFTDQDRSAVAELAPATPVWRIPFGTPLPSSPLDPVGQQPPTLLFVGSFIHPPNVDAAVRLARTILPLVRRRHPDARLCIVGDSPPDAVRRLAGAEVQVTGRVPQVEPYLDIASVVVVPLRLGGGMRVKVLEALAAGKAVVASRLAVQGLDVIPGDQLCIADDDVEFADRVGELLDAPEHRLALARRARAWACANLGWDRSVAVYDRLYSALWAKPAA